MICTEEIIDMTDAKKEGAKPKEDLLGNVCDVLDKAIAVLDEDLQENEVNELESKVESMMDSIGMGTSVTNTLASSKSNCGCDEQYRNREEEELPIDPTLFQFGSNSPPPILDDITDNNVDAIARVTFTPEPPEEFSDDPDPMVVIRDSQFAIKEVQYRNKQYSIISYVSVSYHVNLGYHVCLNLFNS